MSSNAFTAGVRPGGLNNENEIRILVCLLVHKRQSKLTEADLLDLFTAGELANYFEVAGAIADMLAKDHLNRATDGTLNTTDSGADIADALQEDVPLAVREKALSLCDALLEHKTKIGQHKVQIIRQSDGYTVRCSIVDLGTPIFTMELYAPERDSAELIERRFVENGARIYSDALAALTGDGDSTAEQTAAQLI